MCAYSNKKSNSANNLCRKVIKGFPSKRFGVCSVDFFKQLTDIGWQMQQIPSEVQSLLLRLADLRDKESFLFSACSTVLRNPRAYRRKQSLLHGQPFWLFYSGMQREEREQQWPLVPWFQKPIQILRPSTVFQHRPLLVGWSGGPASHWFAYFNEKTSP